MSDATHHGDESPTIDDQYKAMLASCTRQFDSQLDIDALGVELICEALMEVGGWEEIDGDGDNASIIADHIRRLPTVLADRNT